MSAIGRVKRFFAPVTTEFEYKNPREGRSLGESPDGPALPRYPTNYPLGAGPAIDRSIQGKNENEKTFFQKDHDWQGGEDLEEKQKGGK